MKDNGVIYNIITLYSDVVLAEILGRMTLLIMAEAHQSGAHLNAVGCDGPDYTLRHITEKISSVVDDTKWCYPKLLERVRATCFDPKREDYPDYKKGLKKVADHFQVILST